MPQNTMILFKPSGSLDIATDPSDLPDDGMQRCKNLRLDEKGVLKLRDGSYKLNDTELIGTMDFVIEQGGNRYILGGKYIYRNETLISTGVQCETPSFSPAEGAYSATQTVTITSATAGVEIFYTVDGNTPTKASNLYSAAISVPLFTTLKAIATRDGFLDSAVAEAYYSATVLDFVTETNSDNMWTETNNDELVGEGTS
jgi:hypothetical protein